ncbi:hypothetical protein Tco_0162770 [Tanacetum coccineum]
MRNNASMGKSYTSVLEDLQAFELETLLRRFLLTIYHNPSHIRPPALLLNVLFRIHKDGDGDASFQLKSIKIKASGESVSAIFQDDAMYENVDRQDTRYRCMMMLSQEGIDLKISGHKDESKDNDTRTSRSNDHKA